MPPSVPLIFPALKAISSPSVSLYRASWVVPINSSPIRDGAVAVAEGRIVAVDAASAILSRFAGAPVVNCLGVLMPGLVNTHIHLELSGYGHIARPLPEHSFCDWIRSLMQARQEGRTDAKGLARAARQMLQEQHESGVLLLLDTGNVLPSPCCSHSLSPAASPVASSTCIVHPPDSIPFPPVSFLLELLGPDAKAEKQALSRLAALPDSVAATPHALYSTTPAIIRAITQRAARLGHIVSLHLAESADELELLRNGNGCFRSFLEERGAWDGSLAVPVAGLAGRKHGAVAYLEHLGLLHSRLLCVHCVQVSDDEARILARHGCKICLCPGSNRFLRVGRAPLELMMKHGLLPAIGTDSIASNESLDLWREMQILREDHPGVASDQILKMATLGGAAALGCDHDYGSLAPGRKAILLNIKDPVLDNAKDAEQLLDILTRGGRPAMLRWIGHDDSV